MTNNILLFITLFSILASGCCSKKSGEMKTIDSKSAFYDDAWELESLSGPHITFDGLYPDKKPYIIFKDSGNQYSGDTSCNVYSGKYTKKENNIHFGNTIKTMAYCEGGGEETFLNLLGKVTKFAIDNDGKLLLLSDDVPIMRFKKIAKPQQ